MILQFLHRFYHELLWFYNFYMVFYHDLPWFYNFYMVFYHGVCHGVYHDFTIFTWFLPWFTMILHFYMVFTMVLYHALPWFTMIYHGASFFNFGPMLPSNFGSLKHVVRLLSFEYGTGRKNHLRFLKLTCAHRNMYVGIMSQPLQFWIKPYIVANPCKTHCQFCCFRWPCILTSSLFFSTPDPTSPLSPTRSGSLLLLKPIHRVKDCQISSISPIRKKVIHVHWFSHLDMDRYMYWDQKTGWSREMANVYPKVPEMSKGFLIGYSIVCRIGKLPGIVVNTSSFIDFMRWSGRVKLTFHLCLIV